MGGERQAANEFHREIGPGRGVVEASGVVNVGDAGVLQLTEYFGLAFEPAQEFSRRQTPVDHFQGDDAPRLVLLGFVNGAHAALTEEADDAIAAQLTGQFVGNAVVSLFKKRNRRRVKKTGHAVVVVKEHAIELIAKRDIVRALGV